MGPGRAWEDNLICSHQIVEQRSVFKKFSLQTVSGTVERQAAHFFRITVTESDLKAGVIISCKSTGKDKFKTVFFDNQVSVTMVCSRSM